MSRKNLGLFLLLSFLLGTFLSAGWLYSRNALFRLSEIEVSHEDPHIRELVKGQMFEFLGRSLFSLSFRDVESEILKLSQVEGVELRRQWPSGLIVDVAVKTPVGMVSVDGQLWQVDEHGQLFELLRVPRSLVLLRSFPIERKNARMTLMGPQSFWEFLKYLKSEEVFRPHLRNLEEIHFLGEMGFEVRSQTLGLRLGLGSRNFDGRFERGIQSFHLLRGRVSESLLLDAAYRSRVVVKGVTILQNSQDRLNLKELVRRKDPSPAAAR